MEIKLPMSLTVVALSLVAVGCGGSESDTTDSSSEGDVVEAASQDCTGTISIDDRLAPIATSISLSEGTRVMAARTSTDSDFPGMVGVAFDLCGGPTAADDLRPVATKLAQAVKASELGETTFSMYVSNYQVYSATDVDSGTRLKVPDFQIFTWSSDAAVSPDTHWEVLEETP